MTDLERAQTVVSDFCGYTAGGRWQSLIDDIAVEIGRARREGAEAAYGAPDAAGWLERNKPKSAWSDPTPEMVADPLFEAIWQCIQTWDINVPGVYEGYCGATGNHVRAILDAIRTLKEKRDE